MNKTWKTKIIARLQKTYSNNCVLFLKKIHWLLVPLDLVQSIFYLQKHTIQMACTGRDLEDHLAPAPNFCLWLFLKLLEIFQYFSFTVSIFNLKLQGFKICSVFSNTKRFTNVSQFRTLYTVMVTGDHHFWLAMKTAPIWSIYVTQCFMYILWYYWCCSTSYHLQKCLLISSFKCLYFTQCQSKLHDWCSSPFIKELMHSLLKINI